MSDFPRLFSPLSLGRLTLANRVTMAPLFLGYARPTGEVSPLILKHYREMGASGAGLVVAENAAVAPEGLGSPFTLRVDGRQYLAGLKQLAQAIKDGGAAASLQLNHAGRFAWQEEPLAPSAVPAGNKTPRALTQEEIARIVQAFAAGAALVKEAGFDAVELHGGTGYLLAQFLSPRTNRREDAYGGSFENRTRLLREVVAAVRGVWPERLALFVRLSATDWVEGGWNLEQSVDLAKTLKTLGVDLVDCSTGGLVPRAEIPLGPGYQVPFAARIRAEAGLATGAVGLITAPVQAEDILAQGSADLVLLGRELLRDPRWPLHAAQALQAEVPWPASYARAARGPVPLR